MKKAHSSIPGTKKFGTASRHVTGSTQKSLVSVKGRQVREKEGFEIP